jgi:hypothetical protein
MQMWKRIGIFLMAIIFIAFLMSCATAGRTHAHQPHLVAALDHLKAARSELEMAEHNKGGHRVKAIELVDQAIDQTKAAIEFGERGY